MILLKVKNLTKYVDNALCFNQSNLVVHSNEICCIVSDNDSRARLFVSVLADQEKKDSGEVLFKGERVISDHIGNQIGIAWQSKSLFMNLSGFDNIALKGGKHYSNFGIIHRKRLLSDIQSLLKRFDTDIDLGAPIKDYNLNERTIIDLISIILLKPKLSIFYKVSRYLTLNQFETLEQIIEEKKKAGNGIIYIPENLEESQIVGDKFYFLTEDGFVEITDHKSRSIDELRNQATSSEELNILSIYDPIYNTKKIMCKSLSEESIDFNELAAKVGMHYHVFRKMFKEKTGISPKQFFLRLKIDKAKELLLKTNKKIDEIAEIVGFSDPLYFSRMFKSKEKISPQNFRKQKSKIYFD
ncbi:MAG: helix-turn-helix domain-containing protein [Spirochaetes bacterium]|nr:helix-turn-helix domain-containing protein [Spirochaetota bacterium]MBN2769558.1 helix-turn-helix domain-containing protein [Spirochaetota bacterium]HRX16919.1 helix-turn-helix domain-containing protein [Spirochaetota bacterium]